MTVGRYHGDMESALSARLLPSPGAPLSASIAALLRERIVSGQFKPGSRLVEAEIARQLETSRGPIREALAQLRAEGLVVDQPRRGSFVATVSNDDIRDIYELRGALESKAARLIVEHADEAAVAELSGIVDGLKAAAEQADRDAFAVLDAKFHAELCRLSRNRRIYHVFVQQAELLNVLLRLEITTQYETLDGILNEHLQLFSDLSSGDAERAAAGCERHLAEALVRVGSMMSRRSVRKV